MITAPTLRSLRHPLLGATLALLASAALLLWTRADHAEAVLRLQQHHAHLAQARDHHLTLDQTRSATVAAGQALAGLENAGQFRPPPRQAWHAHLATIAARSPGNHLEWTIGPARPYPDTPAPDAPSAGLIAATLALHGTLAHEAHLLAILQPPRDQPGGIFLPRRCRLLRTADTTAPPSLGIDCEIDWIALHIPAATP